MLFTSVYSLLQQITQDEKDKFEKEVGEVSAELKLKEWDALVADEQEIVKLKEEIQNVRATRAKMRSIGSSVGSSITIFPPGTPSSSPEDEVVTDKDAKTDTEESSLELQEEEKEESHDEEMEKQEQENEDSGK